MLNRKVFVLSAAIMAACMTGVSAFGIGLQGNWNAGSVFAPGVSVTFKTDSVPLYFAANYDFTGPVIGLTGDYWIFNNGITNIGSSSLNWFLGVGFYANLAFQNESPFTCGLRVPVGLNMLIAKGVFEPYLQVAPSFGVKFYPRIGADTLFWPLSAGFRIWFK
jgi:uncharacterized membrane protein YfbV (UPF0208 family)